jgi:hypothetical protein
MKFILPYILSFSFLFSFSQTEATIRSLEQQGVDSILRSGTNLLKQLWAPEFMVNNPRNDVSAGRDAVFKVQRAGLINYSSLNGLLKTY